MYNRATALNIIYTTPETQINGDNTAAYYYLLNYDANHLNATKSIWDFRIIDKNFRLCFLTEQCTTEQKKELN